MVIISAAICTKGGKVIIGRQYIDMTRGRVEGLYSTFSKLIQVPQAAAKSDKAEEQFTILETDAVRYLYQTLDLGSSTAAGKEGSSNNNALYLVVVTTIFSNIIENVAALQSLYKLVNYITTSSVHAEGQMSMMRVLSERFFDVVHAFDLVITPHGLLNESSTNLNLINTILEMDSLDEKIAQRDEESKTAAARQLAKQKAAYFRAQQHAAARTGVMGGGSSFGGSALSAAPVAGKPSYAPSSSASHSSTSTSSSAPAPRGKGLVLSSKKGLSAASSGSSAAAAAPAQRAAPAAAAVASTAAAATAAEPSGCDLDVKIVEQLSVEMNQDATVNSIQLRGELSLCAQTPEAGHAAVQLAETGLMAGVEYKTHPQIDREQWSSSKVVCGKGDRPFPTGHEITVVKWMYESGPGGAHQPPLSVTCWPTASRESILMTVEYEVSEACAAAGVRDLVLVLPLPPEVAAVQERDSDAIEVGDVQEGTVFVYDRERGGMVWHISGSGGCSHTVDAAHRSGSIEFSINLERVGGDADCDQVLQQLFPMHASFELDAHTASPTSPIRVESVVQRNNPAHAVSFSQLTLFKVVRYDIILNQF